MEQNAASDRRFLILLILLSLMFRPGLLVCAVYRLLRNAVASSFGTEGLVVGAFLVAVALFGSIAGVGMLTAISG